MAKDSKAIYQKFKQVGYNTYDEETHCPLLIDVMSDPNRGTVPAFCVEIGISDSTFYRWLDKYPIFAECYGYAKMVAKRNWEVEGNRLQDFVSDEVGCRFEIWRLKGWSQFGIGKNSRIRLNVREGGTPADHYQDLLKQANGGDFTAGEIKQLMEAVNVGLNAHNAFELQKQIDTLKSDLEKMEARSNG